MYSLSSFDFVKMKSNTKINALITSQHLDGKKSLKKIQKIS